MPRITIDDLNATFEIEKASALTKEKATIAIAENPIRFFHHYTSWNGFFGSGVASMAGKVGRCRHMFLDTNETIEAIADRSVHIASYFFDAARDEFNDSSTEQRGTHRCLAQAMLKATIQYYSANVHSTAMKELVNPPLWLKALEDRVSTGYGSGTQDTNYNVFRAMGYHVGSEAIADREFSVIDELLESSNPWLRKYLIETDVSIAGEYHNAYHWLRIHSGHLDGGAVEMEHFEYAMEGVRLALTYTPEDIRDDLRHQVMLGYLDFAQDHNEFFVNIA
jgi:hypothetical protein